MEGDLGKVKKGDCIVTFKRSSIFAIKKEVERTYGDEVCGCLWTAAA